MPNIDTPAFTENLLLWLNKEIGTSGKSKFQTQPEIALNLLETLARDDGQTLANLIKSSAGLAPNVFRQEKFYLDFHRPDGPEPRKPAGPEESMCHSLWKQQITFAFGQNSNVAFVHSYQVPLVKTATRVSSDGQKIIKRYIDLLASASNSLPIVIEAKHSLEPQGNKQPKRNKDSDSNTPVSKLFTQFIQGLCYSVTLRYTWIHSLPFREAWSKLPTPSNLQQGLPDDLVELPVILAADPGYWAKTFNWGKDHEHWMDLCTLVTVAQNAGYPIYLGVIQEPGVNDPQWQFRVIPWENLPTPTTNGPIQFPEEPTS